jgi:FMN phosphatase YigB (HAD superfamily)
MTHYSCLKLVIFDLDDTLHDISIMHMPQDVKDILTYFKSNNVPMAIASLNIYASKLLRHYDIDKYFSSVEARKKQNNIRSRSDYKEHFYMTKFYMFCRFLKKFQCKPQEVLLFDDNQRHIDVARSMNIHCVKVNPAFCLRWKDIFKGLELSRLYPSRRRSADF